MIKIKAKTFLSLMILLFSFSELSCEEIKVLYYNLWNYFVPGEMTYPKKKEESKKAIVELIKEADPDIFMMVEMGTELALEDLMKKLKAEGYSYPYTAIMHGRDPMRHLAMISKYKALEVNKVDNLSYMLRPKTKGAEKEELLVSRGFLHVIFNFKGYKLHIISAHLKSKIPDPKFHQTQMRRYEARALRSYAKDILSEEPEANILIVGDMNDTFDSSALEILRGSMNKKNTKKFFDLRPLDQRGCSWTHWWDDYDDYARIDYTLASYSLLPEIKYDKNRIFHLPEFWIAASDHRPLYIYIDTEDKELYNDGKIEKVFPEAVYRGYESNEK